MKSFLFCELESLSPHLLIDLSFPQVSKLDLEGKKGPKKHQGEEFKYQEPSPRELATPSILAYGKKL